MYNIQDSSILPAGDSPVQPQPTTPVILPPNHCARVVLVGLAAWLIGILGFIALGTGMDDLQKIKQGKMRPEGKGLIVFGMVSGMLGFVVNAGFLVTQCIRK